MNDAHLLGAETGGPPPPPWPWGCFVVAVTTGDITPFGRCKNARKPAASKLIYNLSRARTADGRTEDERADRRTGGRTDGRTDGRMH
jgi:hypothetical protein